MIYELTPLAIVTAISIGVAIATTNKTLRWVSLWALAVILILGDVFLIWILGDLAAHYDSRAWPSVLTILTISFTLYVAVAAAAFRRKFF